MIRVKIKNPSDAVAVVENIKYDQKEVKSALVLKATSNKKDDHFDMDIHSWPEDHGAIVSYKALKNKKYVSDSKDKDILIANAEGPENDEQFELSTDDSKFIYFKSREDENYVSYRDKDDNDQRILRGNVGRKGSTERFRLEYVS